MICLCMSVLLEYHRDQVAAQNTLARKLPLPPEVLLQDFNQSTHSNMLHEARLVGEAALDRSITLNVGEEAGPKWVQIVPFFPVSVEALPAAYEYVEGSSIQAMPQETKEQLAAAAWHIRGMQDTPMGMLIIEAETSIDEAVLHNFIGQGTHGPLVALSGSLVAPYDLNAQATAAFRDAGMEILSGMPMILPYPNGARVTGPAPAPDVSVLRDVFGWGVAVFTMLGLYFSLGCDQRNCAAENPKPRPVDDFVEPLAPVTNVFADIRTQEELRLEEERTAAASKRPFSRRVLSRLG